MKLCNSLTLLLIACLFLNCSTASSSYKLQKKSPLKFHKIEVQKWSTNIQRGDSGIKMYLILPSDINSQLDSVYFNNVKTNIYRGRKTNTYFANFRIEKKRRSNRFPFILKNNECVVSYIEGGKRKYYKYSGVKDKS